MRPERLESPKLTNRGIVALYAEFDERADYLRRASELKTKFLSNVSHEFRTPLNSIVSLARLLLDRIDGELTAEQFRQVHYIESSACDLQEMVNDLLDLAKVEGIVSAKMVDVREAPVHRSRHGNWIAFEHHETIFKEFSQLAHRPSTRPRGRNCHNPRSRRRNPGKYSG
jgi:signal transduction histidine kinase